MIDEDLIKFFASTVKSGFYGDIRASDSDGTVLSVENGAIRRVLNIKNSGFGLRLMKDGIWSFASSNDISKKGIKTALESAYSIIRAKVNASNKFNITPESNNQSLSPSWKKDPREIGIEEKLKLVMDTDKATKQKDIYGTMTNYQDYTTHWIIGSTNGNVVSFYESHPKLVVSAFIKDNSAIQVIRKNLDGSSGFELFAEDSTQKLANSCAEEARNIIGAKPLSGGKYDVVLDYAMTGVYVHEALGHATEADSVLGKNSILENKIGKNLGNEMVTIIDDPTIKGANGSFVFDQEGTKGIKRKLVERGILKEYLHTLETAGRMSSKPNGSARSPDFSYSPIARMSNTFIAAGDFKQDIYKDVKLGIAFFGFQYGYVDSASGKFMFKSQYGRMIRNGMLSEYVRDAALAGNTLDVLNKIDAIGSEVKLDGGICGKEGQWVPVTSGGPDIRMRGLVVGGQ